MRSLYIDARMLFSSGVGVYLQNLLKGLAERELPATLLLPDHMKDSFPYLKHFQQKSFNYPIYSPQEQFAFCSVLPSDAFLWSPHFNVPLFFSSKRQIVTIHDLCHLVLKNHFSLPARMVAKLLLTKAVKASKIFCCSQFTKSEIRRFFPKVRENKIEVTPHGLDHSFFQRPDEKSLKKIKEQYQLPSKYLLFLGNIKTHKNLHGLLQALCYLKERNFHLVIVGKSLGHRNSYPLKEKLAQMNLTGYVKVLGEAPQEALPSIYSLATATILPSFYEGFGIPGLEGLSCGTPALMSNRASLPEIYQKAALYFDPANIPEMAEKIDRMMNDLPLREKIVEEGIKLLPTYQWEKSVEKHYQLFQKILKK